MPVLGYILMLNIILKHSISVISTSEDSFLWNKQENCTLLWQPKSYGNDNSFFDMVLNHLNLLLQKSLSFILIQIIKNCI